ncbi:MAG: tyrosine-type recombinase/integrase [Candidatus Rifleibacteriota bacterium]
MKNILQATGLKNLKPKEGRKLTKYHDGEGLYLWVYDDGKKSYKRWFFRYRFEGVNRPELLIGAFPTVSAAEARAKADEARELLKNGIDPAINRKATKQARQTAKANSFEVIAREWLATKRSEKAKTTRIKEIANLENDVFPFIGDRAISEITPPEILEVLRKIEARGAVDTAHRAKSRCSMIFRYAIATGRCISDPCRDLTDALQPISKQHFTTITDMQRFSELLRAIESYMGTPITRAALRLMPLLATRSGELRHAKWEEIDLDAEEWRYFVTKTKVEHLVPLPRQAVKILEELKPITYRGGESFVFPHINKSDRVISDNSMLGALRALGFPKEEMTVHGFRATCKTELLELGYPMLWVEKQLAHAPKEAHGRAYNRTEYRDQRHKMMQAWADYLDELKASTCPDLKALREKYKFQG